MEHVGARARQSEWFFLSPSHQFKFTLFCKKKKKKPTWNVTFYTLLSASPIIVSFFFVHWNSQHLSTKPHCRPLWKTAGQQGAVQLCFGPHPFLLLLTEVVGQWSERPKRSHPKLRVDSTKWSFLLILSPAPQHRLKENTTVDEDMAPSATRLLPPGPGLSIASWIIVITS